MDNSSQSTVFEWLSSESSMSFNAGEQRFTRHVEAYFPARHHRYRILFSDSQHLSLIQSWLLSNTAELSLAMISRTTGLNCIEVCALEPLVFVTLASLSQLEVFEMKADAPVLNQPGLLVMDMDSTAIEIECIDELAEMAGVGAAVAAVTEQAMQGELDFEESLRARVAKLTNADASIIDKLCAQLPLMPGLTETITELKQHQWRTVVASGGFRPFVNHLQQLLDLDAAFANELDIADGKLNGTVSGQVVDAQFKADCVVNCAQTWDIGSGQKVAIGDGANDIPMINIADFGIAYHAKPKLAAVADANISKLNLKALPYLFQLK
ncbi:phosphoserine phosphatase SerB [Shewanella sp. Choline-02u-19]|uniref:phosphoserine phosphatase SerB n=1 Tax=unclassified Shewanella TaxID=196818 RepID=UPI000C3397F7|nr:MULTISPECIES: phosphoserine phosphatase SerB [unclassified Shewanella]PKG55024.1 phosphoserine phosphatase SerB [Shewanella sp. GutDb-MelDb]PKH58517.1 phosphoserine phosphatase SerB [Shewanella sp. Bg11-22]PKI26591.1 phosphoserine phosphatase SerB [Shewanella sp. Choline-02u-19]